MSKSGRVYLFSAAPNDLPKTGNLVLIQDHDKPAMAFRVLQTNTEKSQYIAKRVRRYDTTGELNPGQAYFSIEKVADLLALPAPDLAPSPTPVPTPMPSMTPVPEAAPESSPAEVPSGAEAPSVEEAPAATPEASEENEPNLEIYDYDDELDGGTSPRNLKQDRSDVERTSSPEDDDGLPKTAAEIREIPEIDPLNNMISFSAGFFKNMSQMRFKGGTHNGIALEYSRTVARDLFVEGKSPQDSLSLDFGLGYYSRVDLDQHNDVYKVAPIYAEFDYQLHFSETFAWLFYLGIEYNGILSTENVNTTTYPQDAETVQNIQGVQHTLGTGILYNMGPQWYFRVMVGWDRITAGLALKW